MSKNRIFILFVAFLLGAFVVVVWMSSDKSEYAFDKAMEISKKRIDSLESINSNLVDSLHHNKEIIAEKDTIISRKDKNIDTLLTNIQKKNENISKIRDQVNTYRTDKYDSIIKDILSRPIEY